MIDSTVAVQTKGWGFSFQAARNSEMASFRSSTLPNAPRRIHWLETHPESPPATMGAPVSACRTADWKISKKLKRFLTFLVSMILHRYVHPRRTLHYPPAGHPPPGRHRAGVRHIPLP